MTVSAPAVYSLSTPEKSALTAYPAASAVTETVIRSPFFTTAGEALEELIAGGVLSSSTPAETSVAVLPAASVAVTGIA